MSDRNYSATIEGTLSWDLIFSYDNSFNSGTIRDKRTITATAFIDYATFKQNFDQDIGKQLTRQCVNHPVKASYMPVALTKVDTPDTRVGLTPEVFETLQQTASSTFNADYSKTTTYEREVTIGPHSKLQLYQQRFTFAGICILGSAVSAGPQPLSQTVSISYLVRPIRFISDIEARYSANEPCDAPPTRVLEYSGKSDNVSAGYSENHVWLVPIYTYDASKAATRFDLLIQQHARSGWSHIARGNHPDWTYLRAVEDAHNHSKITELKFYRSEHPVETFPSPYTGHTADINNGGRGGTFLYLTWATATVY